MNGVTGFGTDFDFETHTGGVLTTVKSHVKFTRRSSVRLLSRDQTMSRDRARCTIGKCAAALATRGNGDRISD